MLRFCIEIVQPSSDQGDMPMLFDPMVDGGRVNPSPLLAGPSPTRANNDHRKPAHHHQPADYLRKPADAHRKPGRTIRPQALVGHTIDRRPGTPHTALPRTP
jgi:hypothetical protein